MTAEVAVLNKSGIALAVDSIMCIICDDDDLKHSVRCQKLFQLSEHFPVGIMTYGTAELCGVPWPVIIAQYRGHLGRKSFGRIREYADDLIQFVGQSILLFPQKRQQTFFAETTRREFDLIWQRIRAILPATSDEAVRQITEKEICDSHTRLMKLPSLKIQLSVQPDSLAIIDDTRKFVFKQVHLSQDDCAKLSEIAVAQVNLGGVGGLSGNPLGSSGIVIAGFGENQLFPHVFTFAAHSVFQNQLSWSEEPQLSYPDFDEATTSTIYAEYGKKYARIIPFAQRDAFDSLLYGVSPSILREKLAGLDNVLLQIVADVAHETGRPDLLSLVEHFQGRFKKYREAFAAQSELSNREKNRTLDDSIAFLPLDELGEIASRFVEIAVLREKIGSESPTVGGPVDVATISKADGFIWVSKQSRVASGKIVAG